MALIHQENQDNIESRYYQFIITNFLRMKQILPRATRMVDVFKYLSRAWNIYIEQGNIDPEEIMQNIKNINF